MKRSFSELVIVAVTAAVVISSCGGGGGGNDNGSHPPPFDLTEAREFRAVAGVSMGAYGAMNLGTKHTDLFGTIASLGGPVDMNELLRTIRDYLHVEPQTEIPRVVGSNFTFDHLPPYPGRDTLMTMIQDVTIAFGNPYLHHPDPARQFLASDSEPAHIMQDDAYGPFTTLGDPRGFLDGGDLNHDGLRQTSEPPMNSTDVLLLAGGTLDHIAGMDVMGQLLGGREIADLNGDNVYDIGDGIVVNLSEPFTDGNGNGIFEPDLGETFTDAGLDGVPGTGDFGEGNGQFDYDPDRAHWIAEDPFTRLAGRSADEISTQRIYMDVGEQDEFGFAQHYANLVALLRSKGLTVEMQNGFSSNCTDVPHPDAQFLLVQYQGGHIGIRGIDNNDLENGDVCGPATVWQRVLSMLGYLDASFPDGIMGPGNVDTGSFDPKHPTNIDLPGIRLNGELVHATIGSPSLAAGGGGGPDRDVLVYEPPAFFNNPNDTFPVVYFLGGYGQEPGDFEQIRTLMDTLIDTTVIQNMYLVFLPGAGGREGSFYVNHVIPETQVPDLEQVTSGRYEDSTITDLIPAVEHDILNNRVKRPGD